jgi:hypothetical protein
MLYSTHVNETAPRKNIPTVCSAVSDVVVMLQYNRNAENERKMVNGMEICVLDNFSRTGFLKSCFDP